MENSTSTTNASVSPPKAASISINSKEQLIGIQNGNQSVLHNPYGPEQGSVLSPEHSADAQSNPLCTYPEQPLRTFREETETLNEPLLGLNEHGYHLPLGQLNPSSNLYYDTYDCNEGPMLNSMSSATLSTNHLRSENSSSTLETESGFCLAQKCEALPESLEMRSVKIIPSSFNRDYQASWPIEGTDKSFSHPNAASKLSTFSNNDDSIQLPGIETFSSSIATPPLNPLKPKITMQDYVPFDINTIEGARSTFSVETTLPISNSLLPNEQNSIEFKMPYAIEKKDMPFLISNNLLPPPVENLPKLEPYSIDSPKIRIPCNNNPLPQYPGNPSSSKCSTFPLLQAPLPINYQPLLENLRPIRRTEEIVRLKNDGGKITIVETTDDPGKTSIHIKLRNIYCDSIYYTELTLYFLI